jgi:streptogramin lyase
MLRVFNRRLVVRALAPLIGVVALVMFLCASVSAAPLGVVTEFGLAGGQPSGIALGYDGNLWFADNANKAIGKITPSGEITEYTIATHGGNSNDKVFGIALGADGNMWFADQGATRAIGKVNTAALDANPAATAITEYTIETNGGNQSSEPYYIALGADGNMWFTDKGTTRAIGKITPHGAIEEYSTLAGSNPRGIAPGPEGNMWFTDPAHEKIDVVTTGGLIVHEYPAPAGVKPHSIAPGPDGNMWFTSTAHAIGMITPGGTITEYGEANGLHTNGEPGGIAPGPDGRLWFTDGKTKAIGRIALNGEITEFSASFTGVEEAIAAGPEGNMWFSITSPSAIGRIGTGITIPSGPPGESVTTKTLPPGDVHCPEGGTEFVLGASITYACNGTTGSIGPIGPVGVPGEKGATGSQGAKGTNGAQGVAGAAGPAGPAGKDGQIELVTCKTVVVKKKKKQKCTTKLVSGVVKFTATASRATLSRAGTIYAAGTASGAHGHTSLRLTPLRRLVAGRYTLTLASGNGTREHVTRKVVTIK